MIRLLEGSRQLTRICFILAAVVLTELFILMSLSLISLAWWGNISKDLLWIGAIDSLLVAALMALLVLFFIKRITRKEGLNLVREREEAARQQAAQEIQKREERYRLLFERSGDSIFIILAEGPDKGRIVEVNQAAVESHGFTRQELLSTNIFDLIASPEEADSIRDNIDNTSQGEWLKFEVSHRTKSGLLLPLEVSAGTFDYEGHRLVMSFGRDITVRRQAERAIKESEEKFAKLFRNGPVWMALSTVAEGRYLDVNEAFLRGTDWSREEVIGRTSLEIGLWADTAERDKGIRMLEREGRIKELHVDFRRKGGEPIKGIWSAERIELGDTPCLVTVVTDITERHRAQEALRQSERRYRELVDSISDLICTHDLEGRLLTINQTACQAAGLPADKLVGRKIQDFMLPKFREYFEREYLPAIRETGFHQGLAKFVDQEGQLRYLEYRNRLLHEPSEEPFVIGSARDVTERITAEREMRQLEEQLFQAQKIEALGVLAGGIAHDFNNVLQTIAGYTQLIAAQEEITQTTKKRLGMVDESIQRAADMIKQLMTLARKGKTRMDPVDINQEVDRTVSILEHTLPKMIGIKTKLEQGLPVISGDPTQIEQVLLNLATNASHAMPQGGILKFETESVFLDDKECRIMPGLEPSRYVRLMVSDTGIGMDEETRSHIFEPFFTTKPQGQGTGLGLSTVYSIVNNHSGHMSCQSAAGKGTTFTIYFPVRAYQEASQKEPYDLWACPEDLAGQETILVVDDERPILDACTQALENFGYRPLAAESGEAALEIFERDHSSIDLVILDLNMTGMGGLSCMQAMLSIAPQARILVATGYAEKDLEDRIRAMGGSGLLEKPYRFTDLLVMARVALDRAPGQDQGVWTQ